VRFGVLFRSKLSLVVELREATIKQAIVSNLGTTVALDILTTALLAYHSTPAGRMSSLLIGIKTTFSMRAILSGILGYLVVTGNRMATFVFVFLSAEAFLTKLYVANFISIMIGLALRASPGKVFIGGEPQSLLYVKNNQVVKMQLSEELSAELRKVLAEVHGRETEVQVREESEDEVKEKLLFTHAEASDKVTSLV